ncbi:CHD3-type chromatin-remodeling factor CHR7-like [Telopea speciosissima]|uniref:CHD3-type chromatin-remodeling factor CHR7-like n=1 Tax=Telopea speciosissima TaxID=54955 RepID=UPI001CC3838F|nr:CHD3-type chromatin-remodeling factor CHR7-like [Telopea speciosissima]
MAPSSASPHNLGHLPLHRVSVGDHIVVYWDGDRKWYPAEVIETIGDHRCKVHYEDGDCEWVSLDEVKFLLRRDWKSSIRERRNRDNTNQIKTIKGILFDIEDRLPLGAVFEQNLSWWKEWHDGVLRDVKDKNVVGLKSAALEISLQIRPEVASPWWLTHSNEWKENLEGASTISDATYVVKELQKNAVNWSNTKKLFSVEEKIIGVSGDEKVLCKTSCVDNTLGPAELYGCSGRCLDGTKANAIQLMSLNLDSNSEGQNLLVRSSVPDGRFQLSTGNGNCGSMQGSGNDESLCLPGNCIGERVTSLSVTESAGLDGNDFDNFDQKLDLLIMDVVSSIEGDTVMNAHEEASGNSQKLMIDHSTCFAPSFQTEKVLEASCLGLPSPGRSGAINDCGGTNSESFSVKVFSQPVEDPGRELSDEASVQNFLKTRQEKILRSLGPVTPKVTVTYKRRRYHRLPSIKRNKTSSAPRGVKYSKDIAGSGGANVADHLDRKYNGFGLQLKHCGLTKTLLCSICQNGEASKWFLPCKAIGCSRVFHTFCLYPPLQFAPEGEWICSFCKEDLSFMEKMEEKLVPKKIRSIIGRRRLVSGCDNNWRDEFLIQWVSLSHHHDTWVPMEWINLTDSVRLHHFQKHFPLLDGVTIIDQRKPEWLMIDRVIACRKKHTVNNICKAYNLSETREECVEHECLVKWKGLDYNDATWDSSYTKELLAELDKLAQRHQKAVLRSRSVCEKCSFSSLDLQPSYLAGGFLYDYQLRGLNWLLHNFMSRNNVILADEMGLGKTVQVVSFVYCMKQEKLSALPVLVIAPKSTLFQWEKEFHHWAEELNVVIYQGERESRRCIRAHEFYSTEKNVLFDVLVTNYELVLSDNIAFRKFEWSAIVIDEAHKIKNLDCKLVACLKQYTADFRLLLTGTPLQNTLVELFALLHFLDPKEFADPKDRADSFSNIGMEIEDSRSLDTNSMITRIHDILRPRMLRRMKSDVLRGLIPAKKWVEVPCALADLQRTLYINLLKKNYHELNKGITGGRKIKLNFLLMELRKCCNHPFLIPGQEPCHTSREEAFATLVSSSGKLQLLEQLLPKLKERGNRVLLFSQFTTMLDILEDFLSFLGLTYFRIDGKTSSSLRQEQVREFNKADSAIFIFLFSTRAGGLGIDLPTADRVIIYDPDFNPFMDLQAQSRVHRIGQARPVVVYQLITKCSVEEKILLKSRRKLAIEHLVMNPTSKLNVADLHSVLLHGAQKILSKRSIKATSISYDDASIETLLKLDPKPDEKPSPEENGYLGAIESFVPAAEREEPSSSPKANEWREILGPFGDIAKNEDLGRGKRPKAVVKYDSEDASDGDDMYLPESSSNSPSDDESDPEDSEEVLLC